MLRISSFGFSKGGAPEDSVFVFDCRKLRNPHFRSDMRDIDGRHDKVQKFVACDPDFDTVYGPAKFHALTYPDTHLAFGCFGGKHRSVAMAEMLGAHLRAKGLEVEVSHRELARS